ncbi:MAG: ABC transporter permease [Calditrichaeota bacterium]|nr:ABC transporter permease [Candidatus Cloacimonadota bacterium]MCA9787008.1 ABC transporter permease [Candidatus Cloacimonadota bacterium]MCB1046115.1 ABC transporter permease [Calditrichota bacterium]MCB9473367.1 ABC transporter permease [Candidatus Delongbacteria bacterium]
MRSMGWELFVATRQLRSGHSLGFISVITWFSVLGITIGTAALIIVISVMSGFETEVRDRIIGLDAHVRVRSYLESGIVDPSTVQTILAGIPEIQASSPYILEKGMLSHRGATEGAVIRGVDPESYSRVTDLSQHTIDGVPDLVTHQGSLPPIVLGRYLAANLSATPGDTLLLISPVGVVSAFSQPVVKRFVVSAIFELGIYEFDDVIAMVSITEAQSLFRMGESVTGFECRLKDLDRASAVKAAIEEQLQYPYCAWTWFEMHKNLFSMMKLEKWMMFMMLLLILLVAAFNIVATLTMTAMERRRDIGILKAMGANRTSIRKVFVIQGLVLGGGGTLLGTAIGLLVCWIQIRWQVLSLPPDVYFINALPVELRPLDIALTSLSALVLSLLATLYPANRAASLDPVEAIRDAD